MSGGAVGMLGGVRSLAVDPVDNVRASLQRAGILGGEMLRDEVEGVETDLFVLARRVNRVRSLSKRFDGVELSPHVRGMMRLVEEHLVAV